MAVKVANAACIARCNAMVDRIDQGSGPGLCKIYAGTVPADADTALTDQTLLGTLTFGDPAFGNAVDAAPHAEATANAITGDAAGDADGTPAFWRAEDSDGNVQLQGSAGGPGSGADLELSAASIATGVAIDISSFKYRELEYAS